MKKKKAVKSRAWQQVAVRLSPEDHEKYYQYCHARHESMSKIASDLVLKLLRDEEKRASKPKNEKEKTDE